MIKKNDFLNGQLNKVENTASSEDILKYLADNNIVDMEAVKAKMEMKNRQELLEQHPYKISQGKDGNWRTYLPDKSKADGRRQIKRNTREAVEDIVVAYLRSEIDSPTIEEVFTNWNNQRFERGSISAGTQLRNIQVFNRHYEEFGRRKIKDTTAEEFEDFLENQLALHQLTSKAFALLTGITKGLINRAKRDHLISYNADTVLQELQISRSDFKQVYKDPKEEVFTEEELPRVLLYLVKHLDAQNIGILLMFLTGIRIGELVALKHSDIEDNVIQIRRTEVRHLVCKGKYEYVIKDSPKTLAGNRILIIPEGYSWMVQALKNLNPDDEFIFINTYRGQRQRMTTNSIRRRIERVCKNLDIAPKSPHKARKTYITILLDNNMNRKLVEKLSGHTNISCSERYYYRDRSSTEHKAELISSIPEFQPLEIAG